MSNGIKKITEVNKKQIQAKIDRVKLLELLNCDGIKDLGNQIRATCPIHRGSNNNNFALFPDNNWTCFSRHCCDGKRQDLFSLVMKSKNINFLDAAKFLSYISGVNLDLSEENKQMLDEHENDSWGRFVKGRRLYIKNGDDVEIDPDIIGYFIQNRSKHMSNRGFNNSTLNDFEVGFCKSWKQFEGEDRITFPVLFNNKYVGLQGRCVVGKGKKRDYPNDSWPRDHKYDNMRDFIKTKYLYNFDRAIKYASYLGFMIITEGITDTMILHQIGFRNAVSTFGSTILEDQIKHLCKGLWDIYVYFDDDKAGNRGIEKFASEASSLFDIYRIVPPVGYDALSLSPNENYELIMKAKRYVGP